MLNERQKIVPVAFFISSRQTAETVTNFLLAVKVAALKLKPDWEPGSLHCDDDDAEKAAIRFLLAFTY